MMINDFWCLVSGVLPSFFLGQTAVKTPLTSEKNPPWLLGSLAGGPEHGQKQLFDESDHLVLVCHMFCMLSSWWVGHVYQCLSCETWPKSEKHGMFLDKDIQGCVMTTFWQWHPCHRWVFIQFHVILPRTMLLVKRLHHNNCIFKG